MTNSEKESFDREHEAVEERSRAKRIFERVALAGFALYALAAPHSIAVSWIGLAFAILGHLARGAQRRFSFRMTPLDLPLWLFVGWTALSSLTSFEPFVSAAKLLNVATFLVFYLVRSALTRRTAVLMAALMIASSVAGVLWGAGELALGRGVVVRELRADSPLRSTTPLAEGDAIWRVNEERVASVTEINEAIRRTREGGRVSLSVISRGEHAEWTGPFVTKEMKGSADPSGVVGGGPTRSFRASGWTRHYETFAEMLQMIAQLSLGFALAFLLGPSPARANGRERLIYLSSFAAFAVIAAGIALTAMRTALVAFVVGAGVTAWRAGARGRSRIVVALVIVAAMGLGALFVFKTRAGGALTLDDPSANLRLRVARTAAERIPLHPFTGHGMDSSQRHWNEWGFPGDDYLHAHSTPIQLAFERGLPALAFWLWLMLAFWLTAARAERQWRDSQQPAPHGLALGMTGALAGFLASSLVNYNFGDSEVALFLWWMMGVSVLLVRERDEDINSRQGEDEGNASDAK